MQAVHVQIVRFAASGQPGWVECILLDAVDREWTFLDKVPVFTKAPLDADSVYPQPGIIACEIARQWTDEQGRVRCIIDTQRPWGVSAKNGETQFEVFAGQITTNAT